MTNQEKFNEIFGDQINGSYPCNGVYVTEDKIMSVIDETLRLNPTFTPEDAVKHIEKRQAEWAEYTGQFLVYYMAVNGDSLEIMREWSGNYEKLFEKYDIVPGDSIPLATPKAKA